MFQPVSTSNLNWAVFAFYTLLLVLMLPYPEAINPKTIQGCLKYWMEMEMEWNGMEWKYSLNGMKLYLEDLAPITQGSRRQIS